MAGDGSEDGFEGSITVRRSRSDLVLSSIVMTPQVRGNWLIWGFTASAASALMFFSGRVEQSFSSLLAVALGALLASALAVLVVSFASILILTSCDPGERVSSEHVYTFQDDGLRERTVANDTVLKWGGARRVRRFRSFIAIFTAPGLFHVLPRSAFSSEAEYEGFWATAQRLARARAER